MRSRGTALTLALLCLARLVAAAVSFGAVVGEDQGCETNGGGIPDMFVRFMGGSDEGLAGDLG